MTQDPNAQAAPPNGAAPGADAADQHPAPTIEELIATLTSGHAQLTTQVADALARAEAAEIAARRAQGQSQGTIKRIERELAESRRVLDDLVTRDMTDEQRALFQTRREVDDLKARNTADAPNADEAAAEFRSESVRILADRGVKSDDPRLRAAFDKYVGSSGDPAVWHRALAYAIADVKADDAKTATSSVAERERLAREEERARATQASRRSAGPTDRGAAASGAAPGGKNVWQMSDEEFAKFEKEKDASVGRETPAPRAP